MPTERISGGVTGNGGQRRLVYAGAGDADLARLDAIVSDQDIAGMRAGNKHMAAQLQIVPLGPEQVVAAHGIKACLQCQRVMHHRQHRRAQTGQCGGINRTEDKPVKD